MVVYNLYLVLNDEPIQIYDEDIRQVRFEGSSNDIPDILMDRYVYYVTAVQNEEKDTNKLIIVID